MQRMAPYRDFPFEYPPVALGPMLLPRLLPGGSSQSFRTYVWLFLGENAIWIAVLGSCVLRMARRWMPPRDTTVALLRYGLLAIILAPTIAWRFDLFPAAITAAAVIAVLENSPAVAGALIGLGVATKLYPIALLPVLVAWYASRGNWRSVARLVGASVAVSVAALLPFMLWARGDVFSFLRYHERRGLEIESVPAGILMLTQMAGHATLRVVNNFGAMHLQAGAADEAQRFLAPIFIVAISLLTAAFFRRLRRAEERASTLEPLLLEAVLASLLLVLVTNKAFSPQYLAWLMPFAPFLSRRPFVLMVILFALTTVLFPYSFMRLVPLETVPVLLLNVRNAVAVAAGVVLITHLREGSRLSITLQAHSRP